MSLTIKEIVSKKGLRSFIKFPIKLYKGNLYYVPPLINFELNSLQKDKNPAFDHAEAVYWVVEKEGKIVGRIAAIILNQELKERSLARFGWVDFIDDKEVSTLLFETAKKWAQSKGATGIHGPLGFTDLDFEGALVRGFDEIATQATIYNHPYYIDHYKAWGMEVSTSMLEYRGRNTVKDLKKQERSFKIFKELHIRKKIENKIFKKDKDIKEYIPKIFKLLNECFADLYGYYPITAKQIAFYAKQYFGFIRKEYVCVIVNEKDDVIGFGLTFPSLSKAFQKAKGSLFPFGFIHVLKSLYFNDTMDCLLIAIKPSYQNSGLILTMEDHILLNKHKKKHIKYLNTGPMLEHNMRILNGWERYDGELGKVKRSFFIRNF